MNVTSTMRNTRTDENQKNVKLLSVRGMTVIAMLSALSTVLMLFELPLWFAPNFYKIDFSEVPVLIGAFTLGPIAGVMIELIKILINLMIDGTETAFVGEFANLILGCALVVPSALIYKIKKTKKSAMIGTAIGTMIFVAVGCLLNAYLLLPLYAKLYGMPMENLIAFGTAVNPSIDNLSTFILFAVAPFNLIKGALVFTITALLYKHVSPIIKGYHK